MAISGQYARDSRFVHSVFFSTFHFTTPPVAYASAALTSLTPRCGVGIVTSQASKESMYRHTTMQCSRRPQVFIVSVRSHEHWQYCDNCRRVLAHTRRKRSAFCHGQTCVSDARVFRPVLDQLAAVPKSRKARRRFLSKLLEEEEESE